MQTTRFLEFGTCRGLHVVHLEDGSPITGPSKGVVLLSWLEELGVDMRKGAVG